MTGSKPGLFEWTNEEKLRMQRRSYALLGEFLKRDLPMVRWEVGQYALAAKVDYLDGDQRVIVETWAAALGLSVDVHTLNDHVRVFAAAKVDAPCGRQVQVAIWADIYHLPADVDEVPS